MTFEIIKLPDDEQISEPGFYEISLERHHSQPCVGPSVTSGVLRTMEIHGPSKVWATHQWNPDAYEKPETDALRTGKAMAAYVEGGPDEVKQFFQILPDDRPNRPTKAQYKALREGRESQAAKKSIAFWGSVDRDGRSILTETEYKLICEMGHALANDPGAAAALGGVPELTMAWLDEATGIWCLSRPDNVHFDGTQADYKKINTQGRPFTHRLCDRRIERHGYDMQMAFAVTGFEALTGEWVNAAGVVFQEDTPPYDVIFREIPEEDLRIGQFLNKEALNRIRECLDSGYWPGPGDDTGAFMRDDKARDRLIERMQIAGVAP